MLEEILSRYQGEGAKTLSPLVLAYVGDAVYELYVRGYVLHYGNAPVNKLHQRSRELVKAAGQTAFYHRVEGMLTEEEAAVFKRGRNAKSHTMAKNADMMDYRIATGVEALFGYLYLAGELKRLGELFEAGLPPEKE